MDYQAGVSLGSLNALVKIISEFLVFTNIDVKSFDFVVGLRAAKDGSAAVQRK